MFKHLRGRGLRRTVGGIRMLRSLMGLSRILSCIGSVGITWRAVSLLKPID